MATSYPRKETDAYGLHVATSSGSRDWREGCQILVLGVTAVVNLNGFTTAYHWFREEGLPSNRGFRQERRTSPTPTPTFTAEQLEWLIPRLGLSHPAAWRAAVDPVLGPATDPLTSGLGLNSAFSSSAAETPLRYGLSKLKPCR